MAVLPFANLSADPESEYFTDGMADEIINALSKIQSLRVASRTSSFAFKGKNEDIGEIGKKLKVSTVLEGSMRKMGNKLRITAQLVNVADGYQLWSERYDREMEDVFAIQDDISQAIVKALKVILTEGEKKQIEKARAENVEAYDFYLRGRQYFHHFRRKSLEFARQMFNRAIEIDPEYARAYSGVADAVLCCTRISMRVNRISAWRILPARKRSSSSRSLLKRTLRVEIALSMSKRFDEAEKSFERAMQLDPKGFRCALLVRSHQVAQGQHEHAVKLFERAQVLRPDDYQVPGFTAQASMNLGQSDAAMAMYRKQIKLAEVHLEMNPDDPRACILAAGSYAAIGDNEKASEFTQRAIAADPEDPMLLYNVACTIRSWGSSTML